MQKTAGSSINSGKIQVDYLYNEVLTHKQELSKNVPDPSMLVTMFASSLPLSLVVPKCQHPLEALASKGIEPSASQARLQGCNHPPLLLRNNSYKDVHVHCCT